MNQYLYYIGGFIGIIILTIVASFLFNRIFKRFISGSTEIMKNNPTSYQFLRHVITALIYIVGFSIAIYFIPNLRTLASSMLAGAGILAVAVGFASQHAMSNIVSGIFLVLFKPFRVNDRLKIRSLGGIVEDITLRHTVIRDFENKRIVIPNSIISDEIIINADVVDERICKNMNIGISYDSDLDKAKQILHEEMINHPLFIDHRTSQQIKNGAKLAMVRVVSLGEYAVQLKGWAWAKDSSDGFVMVCDLNESIKKRFDKEGIEIPYPHRTVIQKT